MDGCLFLDDKDEQKEAVKTFNVIQILLTFFMACLLVYI